MIGNDGFGGKSIDNGNGGCEGLKNWRMPRTNDGAKQSERGLREKKERRSAKTVEDKKLTLTICNPRSR